MQPNLISPSNYVLGKHEPFGMLFSFPVPDLIMHNPLYVTSWLFLSSCCRANRFPLSYM